MKNKNSNFFSIHGINNCISLLNSPLNVSIESITINQSIESLHFKELNEILNKKKSQYVIKPIN